MCETHHEPLYPFIFWQETHHRLNYLLDVHIFDPEDLELNSTVLIWPQKIYPVFDLNDEVTYSFILDKAKTCCMSVKGVIKSFHYHFCFMKKDQSCAASFSR